MSIKFFDIYVPVSVVETTPGKGDHLGRSTRMVVRIAMGPDATREDAVRRLAEKIECALETVDLGDGA